MEEKPKWEFLKSTRFWAIVIAAVSVYLQQKGIFGQEEMQLIATVTGAFTVIRSLDRVSDKKVEAAEATASTATATAPVTVNTTGEVSSGMAPSAWAAPADGTMDTIINNG